MSEKTSIFQMEPPIERQSVAEMVATRILEMVSSQALKAGDQLPPERELAEMFSVSRPSVREAIRGLSILGVVKSRQGGGAFISKLDGEALLGPIRFFLSLEKMNIRELYDARALIESDVARRAAASIDEEQLQMLESILEQQKNTLNDAKAFRLLDYKFHEIIWVGSNNVYLKRIGESLNSLGLEIRKRASESAEVLEQSIKDHQDLLDALKARDSEKAAQSAEKHMHNVYQSTLAQEAEGDE